MSQDATSPDDINLDGADAGEQRQSVIRTRVVPAIAGLILLSMIGFILFAVLAPESARRNDQRQVGNVLVFDDPSLASDFELEPIEGGDPVSLEDLRGQVVLLNFWASWCGPCEDEIPILIEASKQFPDDVMLIGIDTMDNRDSAIEMMRDFGVNYLVLDDNGSASGTVAVDYGLVGVPENYVIDAEGNLVAMRRGEFRTVQEVLEIVEMAR